MNNSKDHIDISAFPDNLQVEKGVLKGRVGMDFKNFEANYLAVRDKEQRFLADEQVAELPDLKNHVHSKEWQLRKRSAKRVISYFKHSGHGNLLDIGCGNGWFCHKLASECEVSVIGMDVNLTELEQAARVFKLARLKFVYADIFMEQLPLSFFDFITLNAVVQYFPDLSKLIDRLFNLLKPDGELHFIDSPFYDQGDLQHAKQRTFEYYNSLGFPQMAESYYHHSWQELKKFSFEVLYRPDKSKFHKLLNKKDIPFPWIKLVKPNGKA